MPQEAADLAHIVPLPRERLLSVEYPGFVESTQNAIRTLGGDSAVTTAFDERPESLEARVTFRVPSQRREGEHDG